MPYSRPRQTRPLPRPAAAFMRRIQAPRDNAAAGSSLAAQLGTWNYTVRIYIAFDGPNVAMPTWVDVSPWVETDGNTISIQHGRPDGISDVQVGTCSLVVDNTDGRWTPSNQAGPWAGLIRKGVWLRVDVIPISGIASRRFTGFINALPTGWAGRYATARITASDRFLQLGQAPMLPAMTSAEVLYDLATGPMTAAHYPLAEALSGTGNALEFGDISGNVNPPLVPVPFGSTQATYLNYIKPQGAPAPGYDGAQCISFAPQSVTVGTVLQTTVQPWNTYNGYYSYGTLDMWIQTTTENVEQAFAALYDPSTGCAVAYGIDVSGYFGFETGPLVANSPYPAFNNVQALSPGSSWYGSPTEAGIILNDGEWHHLSVGVAVGPTAINPIFLVVIDGRTVWIGGPPNNVSPNMNTLFIGGTPAIGSYNCFSGNIAGVSWILNGSNASDFPDHFQAGYQGFAGESVDQRIARVARYAGIRQPTTSRTLVATWNKVPFYNGQFGPWTNLAPTVHAAGTQSIAGRQPLDVMREAARTEQMPVFIDRSGYLAIQPITTRLNAAPAWSVHALDLDPSTAFTDDFSYTVNQVSVTPNGGPTQLVNGPDGLASQDQYGVYNQSIQTASINGAEAANAALNMIGHNADPVPRLAPLVIEAATLAAQPGVAVPAAIGVTNDYGIPIFLVTSATAYYGDQVYQTTVPAGSGQYTTIITLVMPVTAGLPYSFQARVTVPAGAAVATDIGMIFKDAGGNVTGYGGGASVTPTVGSSGFLEATGEGSAPANSTTVQLKVEVAAPAGVPADTTWQTTALQFEQNNVSTAWQLPGPGSPNLLTVDQATAGQGTPYEGGGIYGAAWYDAVLASEISTVVEVVGLPAQAPAPALGVFLEGWTETIGAGQHTFAFNTSPQTDTDVFQLDSPTLGVLDAGNTLGY